MKPKTRNSLGNSGAPAPMPSPRGASRKPIANPRAVVRTAPKQPPRGPVRTPTTSNPAVVTPKPPPQDQGPMVF